MVILIPDFSSKTNSDESNFCLLWPHSDPNLPDKQHTDESLSTLPQGTGCTLMFCLVT